MISPRRFQLGDLLPLDCIAQDGDGVLGTLGTTITAAPVAAIFAATDVTTAVKSINLPVDDRYGPCAARFHTMDRLDGDYAVGVYHVAVTWVISAATYGDVWDFEIVAGGDTAGAVIGNAYIERPHRANVLYCLDDGSIRVSRNPR